MPPCRGRFHLFGANGTGSSPRRGVLLRPSVSRVTAPEHTDAAVTSTKSAEVWSGLAERIRALAAVATLYPEEIKKKTFLEGEVQAAVVGGGCDVPEVPVVLEQCTTPLGGGVPAGGPAGHRDVR